MTGVVGWVIAQAAVVGLVAELLTCSLLVAVATRAVLDRVHRARDVRTARSREVPRSVLSTCGCNNCEIAARLWSTR